MTLVQVLANETTIHMSCDFRLTDYRTRSVIQDDAHKLVRATSTRYSALIGVTGVAFLRGEPVADWIARTVANLPVTASLPDLLESLQQAQIPLAEIRDPVLRRHTFVIACVIGTQTSVLFVSNFERLQAGRVERTSEASDVLTISLIKPNRPVLVVAGAIDSVTQIQHDRLTSALRSGMPSERILELLAEVNASASENNNSVSRGCNTAYLNASGQGASRPFLTNMQSGDFIPPDARLQLERFGITFQPKLGPDGKPQPIRMVQSSQVSRRLASEKDFREQFKLGPENSELWNDYGIFLANHERPDEAISAYKRSTQINSTNPHPLSNLASLLWRVRNDTAEAERLYQEAISVSTPSTPSLILSNYANFLDEGLDDPRRAAEFHAQAANDEGFPLALARFSYFIFERHGDLHKADELMQLAQERQPENSDILVLAGRLRWEGHRDMSGAQDRFFTSIAYAPKHVDSVLWAAQLLVISGDTVSAVKFYQRLAKLVPLSPEMECNFGLALLAQRKSEGALRHLARAAKQRPDDLAIQTNLAAALFVNRRRAEALDLVRDLLTKDLRPDIELELLAMRDIATDTAKSSPRIHELVDKGVAADATTIRAMANQLDGPARQAALRLAKLVETHLEPLVAL